MSEIVLYQLAAKDAAKRELRELDEYAERMADVPQAGDATTSLNAMYFREAETGELRIYGHYKSTIDDRARIVVFQKNRQYRWLLAEAYEEFEDYLENMYASVGYRDHSSWLMSDFGSVSLKELPGKDFDWFVDRARAKPKSPGSILKRLGSLYPKLLEIETNNKLNVNLGVAVELIANLRHIIVHRGGVVSNRSLFIEGVLKKRGVWNNGNFHKGYGAFIGKFFGDGEYENVVSLLELRTYPEIPLDTHHDLFAELTGYLMAYATAIHQNVVQSPESEA